MVAFRGNRLWPVIDGKLLASTVTATVTPGVRESRSFLSPYWGGCADWTEEEVKEAEEERMVAARLREEWGEAGGMLFPGQELRSGRGALFSRGG
jgi:hypothetical protein